jgi:hypothetical protein
MKRLEVDKALLEAFWRAPRLQPPGVKARKERSQLLRLLGVEPFRLS